MEMRARYQKDFQKKHNVKLGLMSPFVRAAAYALTEMPVCNAGEVTWNFSGFCPGLRSLWMQRKFSAKKDGAKKTEVPVTEVTLFGASSYKMVKLCFTKTLLHDGCDIFWSLAGEAN